MKTFGIIISLILGGISLRAQTTDDSNGQVAPELVGKWCYINPGASTLETLTNSCITLNADGSYEIRLDASVMNSVNSSFPGLSETDYGTWSVKDARIFYKSSAHGSGSLGLQKLNHPRIESTPTIVLDGAVFCAASPRDPW